MTYKGRQVEILKTGQKLTLIRDADENEYYVPSEKLQDGKTLRGKGWRYLVDYDRATRKWEFLIWSAELAWIVGFAAQQNAYLRHSGQPNAESVVEDEFEFGADSNGEKFDVVIPNPNYPGLDDALDINFIHGRSLNRVSLNKEGFWRFLVTMGFQIGRGREQRVDDVRTLIPDDYLTSFQEGIRGLVSQPAI